VPLVWLGVTIKLFDTAVAAQYRQELETYQVRVDAMSKPGGAPDGTEWPKYPVQPEPMVDSRDKGFDRSSSPAMGVNTLMPMMGGSTVPDRDGTSQQDFEGFESRWARECAVDTTPFKKLKKG
jgi:hypothetical protein